MSTGIKPNTILLIIGIILASGAGYVFGQSPISGLKEDNIALQSQIEQLSETSNDLLAGLETITEELSETHSAFETLLNNYDETSEKLTSTQSELQDLVTSFEDLEDKFTIAQANNSNLLFLYSSVWEKYADLIMDYNELTSGEPIGEMIITGISGIVNGDWEDGNEGWLTQGVSNLVGGVKFLHKNDGGTFTTQSVILTTNVQGLQFNVKPQPFGADITFEVSVGSVVLFVEQYSGINSDFDWEEITIPFRPLMQMREQYGFPIEEVYDIRFTVPAGDDTGANIALDDITLIEIQYQPVEPNYHYTEYIRNGDFDDPIVHDPDFNIPYWYEPGSGGSIGYSSSSGRTGRAIGLHPGKIIQKFDLPISWAILNFWILPNPNNEYSTINVYFDDDVIYQNTFTGTIEDYSWEKVTVVLNFELGIHYLSFEVTTPNTVRIDDVSLIG